MIRWGWGKRGISDCSRCSSTEFSVRLGSGTRGPKGEMICSQSLPLGRSGLWVTRGCLMELGTWKKQRDVGGRLELDLCDLQENGTEDRTVSVLSWN